jgi:hypothetical protein
MREGEHTPVAMTFIHLVFELLTQSFDELICQEYPKTITWTRDSLKLSLQVVDSLQLDYLMMHLMKLSQFILNQYCFQPLDTLLVHLFMKMTETLQFTQVLLNPPWLKVGVFRLIFRIFSYYTTFS